MSSEDELLNQDARLLPFVESEEKYDGNLKSTRKRASSFSSMSSTQSTLTSSTASTTSTATSSSTFETLYTSTDENLDNEMENIASRFKNELPEISNYYDKDNWNQIYNQHKPSATSTIVALDQENSNFDVLDFKSYEQEYKNRPSRKNSESAKNIRNITRYNAKKTSFIDDSESKKDNSNGAKVKPSFFTIQSLDDENIRNEEQTQSVTSILSIISGWNQESDADHADQIIETILNNPKTPQSPDPHISTSPTIAHTTFSTYLTPKSRSKVNELRHERKNRVDKLSFPILAPIQRNTILQPEDCLDTKEGDERNKSRKRKTLTDNSSLQDLQPNKKRKLIKNIYSTRVSLDALQSSKKALPESPFRIPRLPPKHRSEIGPVVIYLPDKRYFHYLINTPLPHTPRVLPFTQLLASYISNKSLPAESIRIKSYGIHPDVTKEMRKYHDSRYLNYLKRQSLKEYKLMLMKNEFLKIEESNTYIFDRDTETSFCGHSVEQHDNEESIFEHFDNDISSDISLESKSILNMNTDHEKGMIISEMFSDEESDCDEVSEESATSSDDENFVERFSTYGIDKDAPMFPSLWPHVKLITSGTLKATRDLMRKSNRVVIHFSGGRHHARKDRAAGYCYVNDIVLSAFQLEKQRKKVMIIDIDIHHGDGTQNAFYYSSRVMTISFHQYGKGLYPGTGSLEEIGEGKGTGYNINVPLKDGISDINFRELFKVVVTRATESFNPDYIIFVCGADALSRDRLGVGNLTTRSYEYCSLVLVELMKRYNNLKLLVTGAGGYNLPDTIRVWSVVTAAFCTKKLDALPDQIPEFTNFHIFQPDFELHTTAERVRDRNSPDYLTEMRKFILTNLEQQVEKKSAV